MPRPISPVALVANQPLPTPKSSGLEYATYLQGLAEAAGELRRRCLDILRHGHSSEAERLLTHMDDIYAVLVTMDYPDAITGGLRRLTDIVRGVTERTRGDMTISLRQEQLEEACSSLEEQLNVRRSIRSTIPKMKTIRASEIGSFLYCQRAWWYQLRGEPSENTAELAGGSKIHESHGRAVLATGCLRILAYCLAAPGAGNVRIRCRLANLVSAFPYFSLLPVIQCLSFRSYYLSLA